MKSFEHEVGVEAVGQIRAAAKRVTGGNCTFVDEDLTILEHLATRAVDAGLTDGLHPTVAAKAALASANRAAPAHHPIPSPK